MSTSDRTLPPNASLEQQRKLAKDLLDAWRAGDAAARERVRHRLPDKVRITLADAQFVLAREYGFVSWSALKHHIAEASKGVPERTRDEFRRLIESRDASGVRRLLAREPGARPLLDAPLFAFGGVALGRALDDRVLLDTLLELGADPNRRSDWWAGPFHLLHLATGSAADRLIEAGAVPDACGAAHLDRVDLMRRMLDEDPERVHERGGDGQTPLHFARSRAMVDLLLERGADIDARDIDHRATPAEWMLDRKRDAGRYRLADYLVGLGARTDIFLAAALGRTDRLRAMLREDPSLIDLRTGQGEYGEKPPSSHHIYYWTIGPNLYPLQVAEQFGHRDAADVMRAFASPRQRFLAACAAADGDQAARLLREHPRLMDELSVDDQRALADAAAAPNARAVELMMELGFDPAVTGPHGGTALHCGALEGAVDVVRAILAHPRGRALANTRDAAWHGTPLGWCWYGAEHSGNPNADHAAVARLLVDAGTRPDPDWTHVPDWLKAITGSGD